MYHMTRFKTQNLPYFQCFSSTFSDVFGKWNSSGLVLRWLLYFQSYMRRNIKPNEVNVPRSYHKNPQNLCSFHRIPCSQPVFQRQRCLEAKGKKKNFYVIKREINVCEYVLGKCHVLKVSFVWTHRIFYVPDK